MKDGMPIFCPVYRSPSSRAPLTDEVEIAIIGGGFAVLSPELTEELGFEDIKLVKKAVISGCRGTGIVIPTAVILRLIFSSVEELNYVPTQKYAMRKY